MRASIANIGDARPRSEHALSQRGHTVGLPAITGESCGDRRGAMTALIGAMLSSAGLTEMMNTARRPLVGHDGSACDSATGAGWEGRVRSFLIERGSCPDGSSGLIFTVASSWLGLYRGDHGRRIRPCGVWRIPLRVLHWFVILGVHRLETGATDPAVPTPAGNWYHRIRSAFIGWKLVPQNWREL